MATFIPENVSDLNMNASSVISYLEGKLIDITINITVKPGRKVR
jgi:hypothetical protein